MAVVNIVHHYRKWMSSFDQLRPILAQMSDKNELHFFFLFSQATELLDHEWQIFVEPIFKVLEVKEMTPF